MSRGNILVVDHEQDILGVIEHNLTKEGLFLSPSFCI